MCGGANLRLFVGDGMPLPCLAEPQPICIHVETLIACCATNTQVDQPKVGSVEILTPCERDNLYIHHRDDTFYVGRFKSLGSLVLNVRNSHTSISPGTAGGASFQIRVSTRRCRGRSRTSARLYATTVLVSHSTFFPEQAAARDDKVPANPIAANHCSTVKKGRVSFILPHMYRY